MKWETSNERIASVSVTKDKEKDSQYTRAHSSHRVLNGKHSVPGAQQPQVHGNGEIVTSVGLGTHFEVWLSMVVVS